MLAVLCSAALPATAANVLRDEFEGPEPSLKALGGDATYKVELHRRIAQTPHAGRGCEQVRLAGNNGTYVYFGRPIDGARVIQELAASVWIKSDRPGLQLMARVVLPRTPDPKTGEPLTTLLRGADYQQVGNWQQLRIESFPRLLERQVRVLRAQFGSRVDAREAYVDLILLNVYGGPGTTNAWVDDLEVAGLISPSTTPSAVEPAAYQAAPPAGGESRPTFWPGGGGVPRVEMKGRSLLVGGRPFFPRAIEHRGETLSRLQALGFNCVQLSQAPSAALAREATGLGLWLIAPPPAPAELEARAASGAKIDAAFDAVLAWSLGSGLTKADFEATKRWAELVKAADPRRRPIVCDADSDLLNYTRHVDVLVARRDPIGTTLALDQYGNWLRDRSRLARGGTPLWASVQTDPSPRLLEQMALLAGGSVPPIVLEEQQIRMLIHTALAARARGLYFTSHSRLDTGDPITQHRAAILELINLHLDLIDRWPASGSFAPTASSNDPHTTGAVIETDLSRLLLPIYAPPNNQFVSGNPAAKDLAFVVPGVPEGNRAYELSPTSFRPLKAKRIAGGTLVTLTASERDSVVVFTQDAKVIAALSDRIAKVRGRATQLTREVVGAELSAVDETEKLLTAVGRAITVTQKGRAAALDDLRECDALEKTDLAKAYYLARHAQQALRDIQRAHWNGAVPATELPLADPFLANFASLPAHYRFLHRLSGASRGSNRLAEGGFEDLQAMRQAGWVYYHHEQPAITTGVDLLPAAAHAGRVGLRLRATAADPKNQPSLVETPPLWITSPSVTVQPQEVVEIQGWVRVAQPIIGSVEGLLVIDTLGGEALAQRVTVAKEWRQFTLFRGAVRSGPVSVTFALAGLGEVWLDDVTMQVIAPRAAESQQAQHLPAAAPETRRP
jgi:hypothetical protein